MNFYSFGELLSSFLARTKLFLYLVPIEKNLFA